MRRVRALAGAALLAALALLSLGGLLSQDKNKQAPSPGRKAAKGVPAHWDKLDLTDAQKADIAKLTAEYEAKVEKLREEIRVLQAELARKRVAVLTDEQKKKLVDVVTAEPPKPKADEKGKGTPPEKEKPKGKDPDK